MTQPVCLIVGAGPGNGAAFARRSARADHRVALRARDPAALANPTAEIPGARGYPRDATEAVEVEVTITHIRADLGPVAVLIYNFSNRG